MAFIRKMNIWTIGLFLAAAFVFLPAGDADAVPISLSTSDWDIYYNKNGAGYLNNNGSDLQIRPNMYRGNLSIISKDIVDLTDASMRVNWEIAAGGQWSAISMGLYNSGTLDARTFSTWGSTHHTWSGSIQIPDNTEYFTTYEFESDTGYIITTAVGNYFDQGGALIHLNTGTFLDSATIHNGTFYAGLNDNYSSGATLTIKSIDYEPAAVPEPASIILLGLGLGMLAGFRRKTMIKK